MKVLAAVLWLLPTSLMAEPYVVAAIGDSISAGFNADAIGNNRDLSWATGLRDDQRVLSHAHRLADYLEREVEAYNVAIAGSEAEHLAEQLDRLADLRPDYTTITIGANDVCTWTEDYGADIVVFEETVEQTVKRLVEMNADMKISMSPVPDIVNLRDVAVHQTGCQLIWDVIGFCRPLLGRARTDLERQQFAERLAHTNDVLQTVADRFSDNVLFDRELANFRFSWGHVSGIDCFHPNVAGQNLYAEQTWQFGWFGRHRHR